MSIDEIGKKALKKKEGMEERGKEKLKLKKEFRKSKKAAKGFEKEGNFSSAYFMYFQAGKALAKLYTNSLMEGKSELGGIDSLKFIADKEKFKVGKQEFNALLKKFDSFLMRGEIEEEGVKKIKGILKKIEKGLRKKDILNE